MNREQLIDIMMGVFYETRSTLGTHDVMERVLDAIESGLGRRLCDDLRAPAAPTREDALEAIDKAVRDII